MKKRSMVIMRGYSDTIWTDDGRCYTRKRILTDAEVQKLAEEFVKREREKEASSDNSEAKP